MHRHEQRKSVFCNSVCLFYRDLTLLLLSYACSVFIKMNTINHAIGLFGLVSINGSRQLHFEASIWLVVTSLLGVARYIVYWYSIYNSKFDIQNMW